MWPSHYRLRSFQFGRTSAHSRTAPWDVDFPQAGAERRRFDQERDDPGADPNGGRVPTFRASFLVVLAPR
jgi:hypothetical protein